MKMIRRRKDEMLVLSPYFEENNTLLKNLIQSKLRSNGEIKYVDGLASYVKEENKNILYHYELRLTANYLYCFIYEVEFEPIYMNIIKETISSLIDNIENVSFPLTGNIVTLENINSKRHIMWLRRMYHKYIY